MAIWNTSSIGGNCAQINVLIRMWMLRQPSRGLEMKSKSAEIAIK